MADAASVWPVQSTVPEDGGLLLASYAPILSRMMVFSGGQRLPRATA